MDWQEVVAHLKQHPFLDNNGNLNGFSQRCPFAWKDDAKHQVFIQQLEGKLADDQAFGKFFLGWLFERFKKEGNDRGKDS
jgi:hypothetical protein